MHPLTSVEKAIDVLFHLHAAPAPLGVSQLGRALGLPKSSAHRLLASLVRRGLVQRDESGRYAPGLGLLALGLGALDREPLAAAARDVLQSEAAALGETVFLVAARAGRLVVLDKAEGTGFLRAAPRVGSEVPVHATAVGKLFLAFGDEPLGQVGRLESRPRRGEPQASEGGPLHRLGRLERFTDRTLTRQADLDRAVARVRREGIARNSEEWIIGLSVLAAPIRVRGRLRGALAVGAPAPRLEAFEPAYLAARIRAAAERVGARLEGTRHD